MHFAKYLILIVALCGFAQAQIIKSNAFTRSNTTTDWLTALGLNTNAPGALGTNLLTLSTAAQGRAALELDEGAPGALGTNWLTLGTAAQGRSALGFLSTAPGATGVQLVTNTTAASARDVIGLGEWTTNEYFGHVMGTFGGADGQSATFATNTAQAKSGVAWANGTNQLFVYSGGDGLNLTTWDAATPYITVGPGPSALLNYGSLTNLFTLRTNGVVLVETNATPDVPDTNRWAPLHGITVSNRIRLHSWANDGSASMIMTEADVQDGISVDVVTIGGTNVLTELDGKQATNVVADLTALAAFAGPATAVWVSDTNRGGLFAYTTSALTANLFSVYAATGKGSGYWVRQFSGPVNLLWTGALPNDGVDDRLYIAEVLYYELPLYIPDGVWDIGYAEYGYGGVTLTNLPSISVTGQSMRGTRLQCENKTVAGGYGNCFTIYTDGSTTTNVAFQSLTLTGVHTNHVVDTNLVADLISFDGDVSNVLVRDVKLSDAKEGIVTSDFSTNVRIEDCVFEYVGPGLDLLDGSPIRFEEFNGLTITGCRFYNCGYVGGDDGGKMLYIGSISRDQSGNARITGNTMDAYESFASLDNVTNVIVTANQLSGTTTNSWQIYLTSAADVLIADNTMVNGGIDAHSNADRVNVVNNYIQNDSYCLQTHTSSEILASGNTLVSSGAAIAYVTAGSTLAMSGCVGTSLVSEFGIQTDDNTGNSITVTGSRLSLVSYIVYAVNAIGGNVRLLGNDITITKSSTDNSIFREGAVGTGALSIDACTIIFSNSSGSWRTSSAMWWPVRANIGNVVVKGTATSSWLPTYGHSRYAPEGVVTAGPGSIVTLNTGAAYIKASGTSTSGWTNILSEVNGVLKAGDTMTGTLTVPSVNIGATNVITELNGKQAADAQLDEWATVSTNSVTALGVGTLTATDVNIGATNVVTELALKAPVASPTFTGTATMPVGVVTDTLWVTNATTTSYFKLTPTNWVDSMVPAMSFRNGASAPTLGNGPDASIQLLLFAKAADNLVHGTLQLNHDYKEGTDIEPHIHVWFPAYAASTAETNIWSLSYSWGNISTNGLPTATTVTVTNTGVVQPNEHRVIAFPTITGSGKTISSILALTVQRTGTDGHDVYDDNIGLLGFDVHYQKDTEGSASQWTK